MKAIPLILLATLAGCAGEPTGESIAAPSKPTATDIPVEQAKPGYWFNQPAIAGVDSMDFQRLCNACMDTARDYQFSIDRTDYRDGLITTQPMISKQFFEVWRNDTGNLDATLQSSLQTIRRTIHFELARQDNGNYTAKPKVLVERLSFYQRRITSVAEYRYVFVPTGPQNTFQTDQGVTLPIRYWYAIGRDEPLERQLAESIEEKLRPH